MRYVIIKKIKRHDNGVSYEPIQDCLWPSSKLSKLPEISAYVEKLEEIKGKKYIIVFGMLDTNIQRAYSQI